MQIKKIFSSHPPDYWLLGLLILLYPTAVWLVPSGGSSIFNILGLGGLLCWLTIRKWPCDQQTNIVIITLLLYMTVTAISWLVNGMEDAAYKLLRRHMLFILAAFGAVWLAWRKPGEEYYWWGVTIGANFIGLTGCYIFFLGDSFRANINNLTQVNPIVFGQLCVLLFTLTSASFTYFYRFKPWGFLLPTSGLILSLVAAIGSETRGAWLALPVVLIITIFHYRKALVNNFGKSLISIIVFFTLFFSFSGWQIVEKRLKDATEEINTYFEEKNINDSISVRTRIDMWKAAFESGKRSIIIGPGKDEFQRVAKDGVEKGLYIESAASHHFPHSELATAFGYHGIIGITVLLFVFLTPSIIFITKIRNSSIPEKQSLPLAGLMTVVCFAIFSLTDSPFEQRPTIMIFSLLILLPLNLKTMSHIKNESKQKRLTQSHSIKQ